MRIIPIMPIESMYGMVYQRAGYYIRRSTKAPTPAQTAAIQRFAAKHPNPTLKKPQTRALPKT